MSESEAQQNRHVGLRLTSLNPTYIQEFIMGLSGISPLSLLLILLIVVVLFGTNKLKTIGSDLGEAVKNFRRALNDDGDKPS